MIKLKIWQVPKVGSFFLLWTKPAKEAGFQAFRACYLPKN